MCDDGQRLERAAVTVLRCDHESRIHTPHPQSVAVPFEPMWSSIKNGTRVRLPGSTFLRLSATPQRGRRS